MKQLYNARASRILPAAGEWREKTGLAGCCVWTFAFLLLSFGGIAPAFAQDYSKSMFFHEASGIYSRTGAEWCKTWRDYYDSSKDWSPTTRHSVTIASCSWSGRPDPQHHGVDVLLNIYACRMEWVGGAHEVCSSGTNYQTAWLRIVSQPHYVSVPPKDSDCGQPPNCLGDPINPANGSVYKDDTDFASTASPGVAFKHYYNSANVEVSLLGAGWRHEYGRKIVPRHAEVNYRGYSAASADNSAGYGNGPFPACVRGFLQIRERVPGWENATATYANNTCSTTVAGQTINIPIYYGSQPVPSPGALIGFDAIRDDGQRIRFALNGSAITAPAGITSKLQQTAGGYSLTDAEDNVEAYDANGRLLSVTQRTGVVQTMSYDGSGRLTTVTDSFGHRLVLTYDGQGRLSSVTRE